MLKINFITAGKTEKNREIILKLKSNIIYKHSLLLIH